ncbi:MAG: hypothetical protein OHK93_004075 [Ramalina farinacea]|uniref:Uncharacterized protein n=1 Tax=Ramalina farinacea TaxID=258253 RepID=A0AA43QG21_9LECA|nr:hypothetical protein [Ramalina farinacea]
MSPSLSKTSSNRQRGKNPITPAVPRKFEKAAKNPSGGQITDNDTVWDHHPAQTPDVNDASGEAGQSLKIEISTALTDPDEVDEPTLASSYDEDATTTSPHDGRYGSESSSDAVKAQPSEKGDLISPTSYPGEQASSFQPGDILAHGPPSTHREELNLDTPYEKVQPSIPHKNDVQSSGQSVSLNDASPSSYGPTDSGQADFTYHQSSAGRTEPPLMTNGQSQLEHHPRIDSETRTSSGDGGVQPHPGFDPTSNSSSSHSHFPSTMTDVSRHDTDSQGWTTAGSASRSTIVQQPEDVAPKASDYHATGPHHAPPTQMHSDIHPPHQFNGNIPSASYPASPGLGPGLPLGLHVLQNFDVAAFADCRVVIVHTANRFPPMRLSLHSLILARSPTLRGLFANGHYSYDFDGLKLIVLRLSDPFSTPFALDFAFRVLYGTAASDFTGPNFIARYRTKAEYSLTWMMESLAFASAGCLLQLMPVKLRGLEIASKIVNWDNIEQALSYALDSVNFGLGGTLPARLPENVYSANNSVSSATATILTPATSQDSSKSSPEATSLKNAADDYSKRSAHFHITCAEDLLRHCIHYVTEHVSDQWQFDCTAKPLRHLNRLPSTDESKSTQAKARLSKIQFGDLPMETSSPISSQDSLISSLVISLPFIPFKALVDLGNEAIQRTLPDIVREREARRKILLQSHSVSQAEKEAAMHSDWSEVAYTERVDVVDGRSTLGRAYTGLLVE